MRADSSYLDSIADLHRRLGIREIPGCAPSRRLYPEATDLVSVGRDIYRRDQRLSRGAADAWTRMRAAAERDRVALLLVSAFRSVAYQEQIFRRKLAAGQTIEEILRVSAAPGFSEHHSGRAVDLTTPGVQPLAEEFESTDAFAWLVRRAGEFGFTMSYPRNNPHGIVYEPWHWRFEAREEEKQHRTSNMER